MLGVFILLGDLEEIKRILNHKLARHVLCALRGAPLRYTDLQYQVTIRADCAVHSYTLTRNLRWLEREHYIERYGDSNVEWYRITALGLKSGQMLKGVCDPPTDPPPTT